VVELLSEFEPEIEKIALTPSHGGCFELAINGELVYSKVALKRHPEPGEIQGLVRSFLAGMDSPGDAGDPPAAV
jgi:selenoprotein W-related protein